MIHLNDHDLQVRLTPDDVESAQVAGVQFARTLAGAPTNAFMLALGEQQHIVKQAISEAGFGTRIARTAAHAFEAGAKLEWQRIVPLVNRQVGGHA